MSGACKTPFHLQWWHLIHLCLGEVKFRISTYRPVRGTFNCAWLVHGASRYLVCARAPHMLSPIRRSTRAESIFVLQKAPCFCNRPALYWGDRINIFCASAFFQHCLFCLLPQSSPEYMLHGEWRGPLAELHASLASAWEVGGQQLSSSILLGTNQLECHFFGPM